MPALWGDARLDTHPVHAVPGSAEALAAVRPGDVAVIAPDPTGNLAARVAPGQPHRRRALLIGAVGVAATLWVERPASAPEPTSLGNRPPIIFFHAHQDDEVLMMGGGIRQEILAGRDVHVVQCTDGGASEARTGSLATTLGYTPTVAEFVRHRNQERDEAVALLGVALPNRHRNPSLLVWEDGTGTTAKAESTIEYWLGRFPGAELAGHSFLDAHIDHRSIGQALDRRSVTQNFSSRLYANPRYLDQVPWPKLQSFATDAQDDELNPYFDYQPTHDRWGVGCRFSAPDLCKQIQTARRTYWHPDSRNFASTADRTTAYAWVTAQGGFR